MHEPPTPSRTNPYPWLIFLALILLAGWLGWWAFQPMRSASDSPPRNAVVFSAPPISSPLLVVLPTLVYFQELPTVTPLPTPTETPNPVRAAWTPTPLPLMCPSDPSTLPEGAVCTWADIVPTSTPWPTCLTPRPGDTCQAKPATPTRPTKSG